jgi:hypothetical protein
MVDAHLFLVIALILLSTKALAIFVKKIHLPQVIGALVAGVLLGPALFGLIEPNETISALAEIGVVLLLFSAGMETDYRQLRSSLKSSALISALGVIAALGGGFGIALLFGKPTFESFFYRHRNRLDVHKHHDRGPLGNGKAQDENRHRAFGGFAFRRYFRHRHACRRDGHGRRGVFLRGPCARAGKNRRVFRARACGGVSRLQAFQLHVRPFRRKKGG